MTVGQITELFRELHKENNNRFTASHIAEPLPSKCGEEYICFNGLTMCFKELIEEIGEEWHYSKYKDLLTALALCYHFDYNEYTLSFTRYGFEESVCVKFI